ncbi:MAG TPA: GDP-mannose 4,6-dehydratase, partial [Nitrolancea sp.]|nr:GDP-mannose 4,6-dehydratase [Nitrolancea sp.]
YGDGQQTRSLCYVADLVRGLRLALETAGTTGEVINLGNPDERTVVDLATIVLRLSDSRSELVYYPARPDDPYQRCPDIAKAERLLGWRPTIDIEQGMKETIDYFCAYVAPEPSTLGD